MMKKWLRVAIVYKILINNSLPIVCSGRSFLLLFLFFGFQTAVFASGYRDSFTEYLNLIPDSRVAVDYGTLRPGKPVVLVLFALPNGNSIEWTAGKKMEPGDDWHFDIQHIKAQTEFVRATDTTKQYIVAYLQASMKAWTAHAARYNGAAEGSADGVVKSVSGTAEGTNGLGGASDSYLLYPRLVDTLEQIVCVVTGRPVSEVVLSSHSGGGRFMFNYISGVKEIPAKVSRLVFIDSNYGFEDSLHTAKLGNWLRASAEHKLGVFSYVDTTVIFNGKRIVSSKGGTGYKTEEMSACLEKALPGDGESESGTDAIISVGQQREAGPSLWKFSRNVDTCFVKMQSANRQVLLLKKENPQGNIYHTVLVERNGFIHSLFFNSPFEDKGYKFWIAGRAYLKFVE